MPPQKDTQWLYALIIRMLSLFNFVLIILVFLRKTTLGTINVMQKALFKESLDFTVQIVSYMYDNFFSRHFRLIEENFLLI